MCFNVTYFVSFKNTVLYISFLPKYLQDIDGLPATLSDKMCSPLNYKRFPHDHRASSTAKSYIFCVKCIFPVCDNMLVIEFHADNGIIHDIIAVNKTLMQEWALISGL